MRFSAFSLILALGLVALGCSDVDPTPVGGDATGDGDGDGDGTGDGDGDATGDATGDGDGDPIFPPDFLDTLTKVRSCGDVYIGVSNDDETMGILFNGAPLAATAHELGETQVRESTLPSADVTLRLLIGSKVDMGCNDVVEDPGVIDHEWTAVSGTVTLTVVPTGQAEPWQVPADATLVLTDVTFAGEGLEPVVVDSWTVADVFVGWFPG